MSEVNQGADDSVDVAVEVKKVETQAEDVTASVENGAPIAPIAQEFAPGADGTVSTNLEKLKTSPLLLRMARRLLRKSIKELTALWKKPRRVTFEVKSASWTSSRHIKTSTSSSKGLKELFVGLGVVLDHGMELKADKCKFAVNEIEFLGFLMSKLGIKRNPAKTRAIQEFPFPRAVKWHHSTGDLSRTSQR
ncbi:hypothetical protein CAEBREN_14692 [Caenorhabditis brenneri]|uniref:Uncharacterized protein n=1 Tax=Caenorhabditis brenneri TaxID=135651 RepID=G0N2Q9_CAEBE|nr:hypothetical protein CAEBREN_14692 [Caenorhabditis brenneri]